mmetsp:Transcript_81550/g.219168  ORF Transcript_81550/g.219168 Transcript_81550/m.219168 type:complete len:227 (-) Transcript_81550:54-734(-)
MLAVPLCAGPAERILADVGECHTLFPAAAAAVAGAPAAQRRQRARPEGVPDGQHQCLLGPRRGLPARAARGGERAPGPHRDGAAGHPAEERCQELAGAGARPAPRRRVHPAQPPAPVHRPRAALARALRPALPGAPGAAGAEVRPERVSSARRPRALWERGRPACPPAPWSSSMQSRRPGSDHPSSGAGSVHPPLISSSSSSLSIARPPSIAPPRPALPDPGCCLG